MYLFHSSNQQPICLIMWFRKALIFHVVHYISKITLQTAAINLTSIFILNDTHNVVIFHEYYIFQKHQLVRFCMIRKTTVSISSLEKHLCPHLHPHNNISKVLTYQFGISHTCFAKICLAR